MSFYNKQSAAHSRFHGFDDRLKDEALHADKPELLFMPHRVEDVSQVKTEQKNGNDFFLHLRNHDGSDGPVIRCENKFETYASGRITLEWISVDRPTIKPGWMATSRTGWLLSWFFKSGDLIALPMDELRALVLRQPGRHQATTALNKGYLTWSSLEDINYLLMNLDNARALDLHYELGGDKPEQASMLRGSARDKRCSADELTQLMRTLPTESTPVPLSPSQCVDLMRELAPVNRKKAEDSHLKRIRALPYGLA